MLTTRTMNAVKIGWSAADAPETAAEELARQIFQRDAELVLFFSTAAHDADRLARAMAMRFPGGTAGCTTAGEIGPAGYTRNSVVAASFGPGPIHVHRFAVESVGSLDPQDLADCRARFERNRFYPGASLADECLGMVLIDGLSLKDEFLAAGLFGHFQPMPIVGGSAGDDFAYRETRIFLDGRAIRGGAAFLAFEMGGVPFRTFRLQDFVSESDYMVITGADEEHRIIYEIDGLPAVDVYSRAVGVAPEQMTPALFASHSLMVRIGGEDYIRSVRCLEPDGGLRLHSAIDEGVVVRLARSDDAMASLGRFLRDAGGGLDGSTMTVCFDCVHRQMELSRLGLLGRAGIALGGIPMIGFSTYGEIVDSIHVNQTMTGVVFGWREDGRD